MHTGNMCRHPRPGGGAGQPRGGSLIHDVPSYPHISSVMSLPGKLPLQGVHLLEPLPAESPRLSQTPFLREGGCLSPSPSRGAACPLAPCATSRAWSEPLAGGQALCPLGPGLRGHLLLHAVCSQPPLLPKALSGACGHLHTEDTPPRLLFQRRHSEQSGPRGSCEVLGASLWTRCCPLCPAAPRSPALEKGEWGAGAPGGTRLALHLKMSLPTT